MSALVGELQSYLSMCAREGLQPHLPFQERVSGVVCQLSPEGEIQMNSGWWAEFQAEGYFRKQEQIQEVSGDEDYSRN